jgi:hypothetical protein
MQVHRRELKEGLQHFVFWLGDLDGIVPSYAVVSFSERNNLILSGLFLSLLTAMPVAGCLAELLLDACPETPQVDDLNLTNIPKAIRSDG